MAGQGTIALEILEDLPDAGSIVCPVGGGGLVAGIATAVRALRPSVRVFGVQAEGAPSVARSLAAGRRVDPGIPSTIADGIRVRRVGERCYDVIRRCVDDVVTVSDADICRAMLALDEHAHVSAEPAGAAAVAALLAGALRLPDGPVVAIVSGGNVDTFEKARFIRRALAAEIRHVRIHVRLVDRRGRKPREMARIFGVLAEQDVNVLDIGYRREAADLPIGLVEVALLLETRGPEHSQSVADDLRRQGFDVTSDAEAPRFLRPAAAETRRRSIA
jgi:threonine dehydratase